MPIGRREERQEGECLVAGSADPAADLDPVMVLIMSLFTPPAMAHNRISQTKWTATDDCFGAAAAHLAQSDVDLQTAAESGIKRIVLFESPPLNQKLTRI